MIRARTSVPTQQRVSDIALTAPQRIGSSPKQPDANAIAKTHKNFIQRWRVCGVSKRIKQGYASKQLLGTTDDRLIESSVSLIALRA
jgi:hypothetical protein